MIIFKQIVLQIVVFFYLNKALLTTKIHLKI